MYGRYSEPMDPRKLAQLENARRLFVQGGYLPTPSAHDQALIERFLAAQDWDDLAVLRPQDIRRISEIYSQLMESRSAGEGDYLMIRLTERRRGAQRGPRSGFSL
jgi:hypothetical protein